MNEMDYNNWEPIYRRFALAQKVLCVAKTRIEGAWAAYCDAVPGINHESEMLEVALHGVKLPQEVARILFPEFANLPYAH